MMKSNATSLVSPNSSQNVWQIIQSHGDKDVAANFTCATKDFNKKILEIVMKVVAPDQIVRELIENRQNKYTDLRKSILAEYEAAKKENSKENAEFVGYWTAVVDQIKSYLPALPIFQNGDEASSKELNTLGSSDFTRMLPTLNIYSKALKSFPHIEKEAKPLSQDLGSTVLDTIEALGHCLYLIKAENEGEKFLDPVSLEPLARPFYLTPYVNDIAFNYETTQKLERHPLTNEPFTGTVEAFDKLMEIQAFKLEITEEWKQSLTSGDIQVFYECIQNFIQLINDSSMSVNKKNAIQLQISQLQTYMNQPHVDQQQIASFIAEISKAAFNLFQASTELHIHLNAQKFIKWVTDLSSEQLGVLSLAKTPSLEKELEDTGVSERFFAKRQSLLNYLLRLPGAVDGTVQGKLKMLLSPFPVRKS